ncbi:MAG: hypothetical protein EBZ17_09765, partial [Actinobacteria bacterium]|nr:hypothetical protein [Actinomycetota bacterium]
EMQSLGDGIRAVIVTDFERTSSTALVENVLDDDELTLLQFLRLPREWESWWLPERPRTLLRWQLRILRA